MKRYGHPSAAVVRAFVDGREAGTSRAPVPGGRRVEAARNVGGRLDLFSYATVVAVRGSDDTVALTPRKYSPSTSKLMSKVRATLLDAGYGPTLDTALVSAKVPGRWGGFGPAWAPSSHEDLLFQVWRRQS